LKVNTTLHGRPAPNVPVQLVEPATIRKSPVSPPTNVAARLVVLPAGTPPPLVTVKVWVALTWPISVLANEGAVVGEIPSIACATQIPPAPLQTRAPAHPAPTAPQVRH
jgi:hypothetical protein